jgi:hypothetical protein
MDQLGANHNKVILSGGYNGTTLECDISDVAKLTDSEADLLMAVTSTVDRLHIFRERSRLEDGKSMTNGRKVFVTWEGREVPGVVRNKGHLTSANRTMFQVELLDEVCRKFDLVVFDFSLLSCPALFVLPQRVPFPIL